MSASKYFLNMKKIQHTSSEKHLTRPKKQGSLSDFNDSLE